MANERRETMLGRYSTRPVGTTGQEILVDGEVVSWTIDHYWALRLLALLIGAEKYGPNE